MKKTALFSDILFTFFACNAFTLCLFRYRRLSIRSSVLLALLCGTLCALSVGGLLSLKRRNNLLKKAEEQEKQKLLLHLILLSDDKKAHFLENVFSADAPVNRRGRLRLSTPDKMYCLRFSFAPVTPDDVADFARFKTKKQKVLLCDDAEEKTRKLCQLFQIKVLTGTEVYRLVKAADALPDVYLGDNEPINKRERFKKLCFSKSNATRFLLSGILILLASLFTPFFLYYWIFGTLLLLAAMLTRIFGS